eukprot:4198880-Prymnesium_polylepis.1
MDRDELRQPLWVQLTMEEYAALKRGRAPNLPEGYRYTVRSGGGGRTQTHMVELHVDDADAFDELRAASPYGGSFSVRFPGGPPLSPSSPPASLPNPAEDTLGVADAEAAAEAAAEAKDTQQPAGATPAPAPTPVLTVAQVKDKKTTVPQLKQYCTDRGLATSGVKADLVERLVEALAGGEGEEEEEIDETGEYEIVKIVDRRVEDRQVQYLAEWKGYGVEDWQP